MKFLRKILNLRPRQSEAQRNLNGRRLAVWRTCVIGGSTQRGAARMTGIPRTTVQADLRYISRHPSEFGS